MPPKLLVPEVVPVETTKGAISKSKECQKRQYDKTAGKELEELFPGSTIRMKLPGCENWSLGEVVKPCGPRAYIVEVDGHRFIRNCRQLWSTVEDKPSFSPDPNDDDDEQILDHGESKGEPQLTPKPSST